MNYGQILQSYNIRYETLDGKLRIHCPYHDDKTPSAVIFEDSGHFHCFACSKHTTIYVSIATKTFISS